MTMRNEDGRHLLLDPRFLIHLGGLLITACGLWFGMVARLDNYGAEQARQSEMIAKIEQRLPNSEVLSLRLSRFEERITSLEARQTDVDGWVRITREQLIAKGWKP